MPTKSEKLLQLAGKAGTAEEQSRVIPKFPALPDDVRKRFPSVAKYEADVETWRLKTTLVVGTPSDSEKTTKTTTAP